MISQKIRDCIERYKIFYGSPKGALMIRCVPVYDVRKLPRLPPVNSIDWDNPVSIRRYAESLFKLRQATWEPVRHIDDDGIVFVQNLAGTGMIGASFVKDAELHQEADTDYLHPPLKTWDDSVERIGFDPDNKFYRAHMVMLRVFVEHWDGTFGIIPFTHFSPADLANQFRGNEIMYDFYDEADRLHALLDRCADAILQMQADIRRHHLAGYDFPGGSMGCWMPGGSYIGCDIGDMIDAETLAAFDVPRVDRICAEWGGGYLHHHELGVKKIGVWSRCTNLSIQQLNRDPNVTHLAELIDDEILTHSRVKPIQFIATYEEFLRHHERWAGGRFCVTLTCENEEQMNDALGRARRLRGF